MKRKNMFGLKTKMDQAKLCATSLVTGAMALPMTINASSGFTAYSGTSADKVMEGIKKFFGTIGTWGGGIMTVVAIFAMILALKNEDTENRNKAAFGFLVGIALLSTGAIINLFFD